MTKNGTRGLMVISPAIRHGIILSACENLKGFNNVLRRLRADEERSAYIELMFAARLVKKGFSPVLEPPLAGKVLDAWISTDDGDVYFEVIAPEMSDAIREMKDSAWNLAGTLCQQNPGKSIEVLLSADIDEAGCERVIAAVREHALSDEIWELDSIGRITTRCRGNDQNVISPTIRKAKGGMDFSSRDSQWPY